MTGRPAPPVPVAWLRARLKQDKSSPTGFVWAAKRPREDFKDDQAFVAWHSTNAGRVAGMTHERSGKQQRHVMITHQGVKVSVDLRMLEIAFATGAWPTGKLPQWPDIDSIGHTATPLASGAGEGEAGA